MTFATHTLRPIAFGLATLIAGFGASAASACPDWQLNGTPLSYSADELMTPQAIDVVAGGNVDLSGCPMGGHGYVITQPDFDFDFRDNARQRELTLRVEGSCDTVLLVNDARGDWHFSDDANDSLDPAIHILEAPAGAYDIWVGTYSPATCQAQLILTTAPSASSDPGVTAPPDPGNLTGFRQQVGQTLAFTVTGATNGSVWGSGIYTDDSSLAAAAVHAGVLMPGQSGVVQVTILPGQQSYQGSAMNGVQSANYGSWTGSYSFVGAPAMPTVAQDPGNLTGYRQQVGQTLTFMVTGAASGSVWGSGIYTDDSSLAAAAVHAGVLQVGQTAAVDVTILPGQASYQGSSMNGVQSANYGSWTGSYSFPAAPQMPAAPAGK